MGFVAKILGGANPSTPAMQSPLPPPPAYVTPKPFNASAGNQSAGAMAAGDSGFGSTIITGPQGLKDQELTSKKALLGN